MLGKVIFVILKNVCMYILISLYFLSAKLADADTTDRPIANVLMSSCFNHCAVPPLVVRINICSHYHFTLLICFIF